MTNRQENNLSLYVEEQFLNQEREQIQEKLSKFRQIVPNDFIKLITKDRNHMCSTQGWKEPICERYIFFNQEKSIQIDIFHSLLKELEIESGKNIPYSVYISPVALDKEPNLGAITIENKKEIFIQKPLSVNNLEAELTNWLTEIKILRGKNQDLEKEKIKEKNGFQKLLNDEIEKNTKLKKEVEDLKVKLNELSNIATEVEFSFKSLNARIGDKNPIWFSAGAIEKRLEVFSYLEIIKKNRE